MSICGYVDIENDEMQRYFEAVSKKAGICEIPPRGRFNLVAGDRPRYAGLVCSERMGGRQTGIGAEQCENCKQP